MTLWIAGLTDPEVYANNLEDMYGGTIIIQYLDHVIILHQSTASGSYCVINTHTLLEDMYEEPISNQYLGHVIPLHQSTARGSYCARNTRMLF